MSFARHRDFKIQKLTLGHEREPLIVIDSLVADPDELVELAAGKVFSDVASYYPGVRTKVPLTFQAFLLDQLRGELASTFDMNASALRFTACHFSLVTTPPERLTYLQRVPHVDSLNRRELASIFYLFKRDFGGTAFYRHRATGFESLDDTRKPEYWKHIEAEQAAVEQGKPGYITGDTDFYEQIGHQDGVYNRMLVYRRTSLHSGAVAPDFVPNLDPRLGRLSINGFLA